MCTQANTQFELHVLIKAMRLKVHVTAEDVMLHRFMDLLLQQSHRPQQKEEQQRRNWTFEHYRRRT